MNNASVFTRPGEMTPEEIQLQIKEHQEKVRWFEEELKAIKTTFKGKQLLARFEIEELKKRRRRLGVLKERHQEKIRELKEQRSQLHTTNES